jgi:Mn-dependent DtxR family transcriptional regulator
MLKRLAEKGIFHICPYVGNQLNTFGEDLIETFL